VARSGGRSLIESADSTGRAVVPARPMAVRRCYDSGA